MYRGWGWEGRGHATGQTGGGGAGAGQGGARRTDLHSKEPVAAVAPAVSGWEALQGRLRSEEPAETRGLMAATQQRARLSGA